MYIIKKAHLYAWVKRPQFINNERSKVAWSHLSINHQLQPSWVGLVSDKKHAHIYKDLKQANKIAKLIGGKVLAL